MAVINKTGERKIKAKSEMIISKILLITLPQPSKGVGFNEIKGIPDGVDISIFVF